MKHSRRRIKKMVLLPLAVTCCIGLAISVVCLSFRAGRVAVDNPIHDE